MSLRKRRVTPQPIAETREEIAYSYAYDSRWMRDTQQPTAEARLRNLTPHSRDGQGDHGIKSKKEEGRATTNWGDKTGDRILLCVAALMDA